MPPAGGRFSPEKCKFLEKGKVPSAGRGEAPGGGDCAREAHPLFRFQEGDYLLNFLIGDVTALYPLLFAALRRVEHIAMTDQRLRPVTVKYDTRFQRRRDFQRDTARNVRFHQARYHVGGRALCRDYKVNPRRAPQFSKR